MKNYYVKYPNGGGFNNLFCDKKAVDMQEVTA